MGNGRDGCEYGRILERRVGQVEKDVGKIVKNLQNRPSWATTVYITLLTSLVVGLLVAHFA